MTKDTKNFYNVVRTISISNDQSIKLQNLANKKFEGNISRAVRFLLDKLK